MSFDLRKQKFITKSGCFKSRLYQIPLSLVKSSFRVRQVRQQLPAISICAIRGLTDSPMLTEITNMRPALKQQVKYMLTAMLIKMAAPITSCGGGRHNMPPLPAS